MAGNGIVEVTDANFDADVLKSDKPVSGGLLGKLVRPLPRHRSHRRRAGEGLPGQKSKSARWT